MAWERWQSLTEEEKERYKLRARHAAAKGREFVETTRAKQTGRGRKRRLRG